jgi:hypothetical protein
MTDGSLRGATRSRITNDPLRRGNGRTTGGRRLRDLVRGLMQRVGDPGIAGAAQAVSRGSPQDLAGRQQGWERS